MSEIEVLKAAPPDADPADRPVVIPDAGGETAAADQSPPPTLAVWIARLVALSMLAFIIGYLLYCIAVDNRPAAFDIEPDWAGLEARDDMFVLPVRVVNDSTEAITSVVLDVELDRPGESDDESLSLTFPLMGEGEAATAELRFDARPSPETTRFRVTSYQSP